MPLLLLDIMLMEGTSIHILEATASVSAGVPKEELLVTYRGTANPTGTIKL